MGLWVSRGWLPGYPVAGYWLKKTKRSQNQISRFLSSGLIWNRWKDVAFLWSRTRQHKMPNLCLTAHIRISYRFSKHEVAAIATTFNQEALYYQWILLLNEWVTIVFMERNRRSSWDRTNWTLFWSNLLRFYFSNQDFALACPFSAPTKYF